MNADDDDERPIRAPADPGMPLKKVKAYLIAEAEDEGFRPATLKNKQQQWEMHLTLLATQGVTTLAGVNRAEIKSALRAYKKAPVARSGLPRKSSAILTHAVQVRTFWRRAHEHRFVPEYLLAGSKLPRSDQASIRVATDDEVVLIVRMINAYYEVATHPDMKWSRDGVELERQRLRSLLIFYLAVSSGLRRSEIVGIGVDDVDLAQAIVRLTKTKSRKVRESPLAPQTIEIVKQYNARRSQAVTTDRLIYGEMGEALSPLGASRQIERILTWGREQGYPIPHLTLHSFRHKAIGAALVDSAEAGRDLAGHASIVTTQVVYGHTVAKNVRETFDRTDVLARLARQTTPDPAPEPQRKPPIRHRAV